MSGAARYLPGGGRSVPGWLKVTGVWLLLIIAVTAIAGAIDPKAEQWSWAVLLAMFVGLVVWSHSRAARFNRDHFEALRALSAGSFGHAAALYGRWLDRHPSALDRTARHNLAWVRLKQGDPDGAADLLVANHRRGIEKLVAIKGAVDLSLCHALLGRLDMAKVWLAESDRLGPRRAAAAPDPTRPLVDAVIACRAGRAVEASTTVEQRWAELEGMQAGDTLRPLRVVRAFALATSGGPRNAGKVDGIAAQARPLFSGEYDFLGVAWPELQAFLASHRLSGQARSPTDEARAAPPEA